MKKSIIALAAMALMMVGTMSACAEKNPYPGYEKNQHGLYYQFFTQNDGELPQYHIENSHPAIVTKEQWDLVQVEMERLLRAAGSDLSLPQVREAARTLFRLNYISPYTRRPKSVLVQMTPLQKQLFDLVH